MTEHKHPKKFVCQLFPLLILIFVFPIYGEAQNTELTEKSDSSKLKLYLDCHDCNSDFFRRNLSYVDFVRDPKVSDLHLLVTEQQTASDGRYYGFNFIGSGDFTDLTFKLGTVSPQSDTELETWQRLLKTTKMGLMPYLSRIPGNANLQIEYIPDSSSIEENSPSMDNWDYWVFRFNLETDIDLEESQKEYASEGSFQVDRITEALKFRMDFSYYRNKETFIDDNQSIESLREEIDSDLEIVGSLSPRWSIGLFSEIRSSTYQNINFSYRIAPAIEYNIFPWDQSDRKIFSLGYHINGHYFNYTETTIYDLNEELRFSETMRLALILRQPWGEVETELEASHYLHDFSRNRLTVESRVSVNIAKGLSIYTELNAGLIHDQLYLPAGEVTTEELLLRLRQLESTYELSAEFGVRITFGSIYNNIVNQRL